MNQPIPFRLSPIDEPVPYAVTETRERLHQLTRRCDELSRRIDAASRNFRIL